MEISLDGRIHPSRWTRSPDGDKKAWGAVYERVHRGLNGDAWLVGRVTMAEMSGGPPSDAPPTEALVPAVRPIHVAPHARKPYAIGLDRRGTIRFAKGDLGGDSLLMVLGPEVPDAHLNELARAGVSYLVTAESEFDVKALFEQLHAEFGIARLLIEGGGKTCGAMLAAGVVDELSVLVAPAIDGAPGIDGVFDFAGGLAGKLALRFLAAEPVEHGEVLLRYQVLAPAAG